MMELPIRVLAVLGAAAVGAFGTGGLIKLVARFTLSRQQLPPRLLQVLRGLGAVAHSFSAMPGELPAQEWRLRSTTKSAPAARQ